MSNGDGGLYFTVVRSWFAGPTPKKRTTRRQRKERAFRKWLENQRRIAKEWARTHKGIRAKGGTVGEIYVEILTQTRREIAPYAQRHSRPNISP